MIRKTMLIAVFSCMSAVSHQVNAGPSETEISDYLKSNPNDLSGLQHTRRQAEQTGAQTVRMSLLNRISKAAYASISSIS